MNTTTTPGDPEIPTAPTTDVGMGPIQGSNEPHGGWVSFRPIATDDGYQIELRMGSGHGVLSLDDFEKLVVEYIGTHRGTPAKPDHESVTRLLGGPTETVPKPETVSTPETVVDKDRPWIVNGRSIPQLEHLHMGHVLIPDAGELAKWNALFRVAAGDGPKAQEARQEFEHFIDSDRRANTYQWRLSLLLDWTLRNRDTVDAQKLVLINDNPSDPGNDEKLRAALNSQLGFRRKREHPLRGVLDINDPVIQSEIRRTPPPTPEPSPYSFEALYPKSPTTTAREFPDDFAENKMQRR